MVRVEVPDWPVPLPPAARRKIAREDGTHRARIKQLLSGTCMGLGHADTPEEGRLLGLARASTLLDELIREEVAAARADGFLSWAQIGAALGMSKQAAQQRYGRGSA